MERSGPDIRKYVEQIAPLDFLRVFFDHFGRTPQGWPGQADAFFLKLRPVGPVSANGIGLQRDGIAAKLTMVAFNLLHKIPSSIALFTKDTSSIQSMIKVVLFPEAADRENRLFKAASTLELTVFGATFTETQKINLLNQFPDRPFLWRD